MSSTSLETDVGLAINLLRVLLRWTQKDLAKAIGIGTSSISDWETGKVIPREGSVGRVLQGMSFSHGALERTVHYIEQMRAEMTDSSYADNQPPPDQVREPVCAIDEPALRMEIDAMSRSAGELMRRFLESHFTTLERMNAGEPSA